MLYESVIHIHRHGTLVLRKIPASASKSFY